MHWYNIFTLIKGIWEIEEDCPRRFSGREAALKTFGGFGGNIKHGFQDQQSKYGAVKVRRAQVS